MEQPRMSYYARVIDNANGDIVLDQTNNTKLSTWYYGKCNGKNGGESQYIVEFDIWNNEPGFTGGVYSECESAVNCKLFVQPLNEDYTLFDKSKFLSFVQARCTTFDYKEDWIGINNITGLSRITGNAFGKIDPRYPISGKGDHAILQTKIKLPSESGISANRYGFSLVFQYDYD